MKIMPIFRKKQFSGVTWITGTSAVDRSHDSSYSPPTKPTLLTNGSLHSPKRSSFLNNVFETGSCTSPSKPIVRRSHLSLTLLETLTSPSSRQHFFSFLEENDGSHLLQFWLDVDRFQCVVDTRSDCDCRLPCTCLPSIPKDSPCQPQKQILNGPEYWPDSYSDMAIPGMKVESEFGATSGTLSPHGQRRLQQCNLYDLQSDCMNSCISTEGIADNAVKIFLRYIAKDATHPIGIPDDLRHEVTRKICSEDGQVDPSCFASVQQFVFDVLEKQHFQDFLQSVHHCRHQLDVLTNGLVSLADIVYHETSLSFFMEFMEQEGQRDLMEFWLAADNFYQHLVAQEQGYDSSQAQDDAMVLYDKYFSLQATCPLGFDDAVRFLVEQNICREGGPLPNCFEEAVQIVINVLEKTYFCQFLGSQLYVKHLTELVNMVESGDSTIERRKRSGSDASSEQSTSTINTLLAMDGTQPGVQTRRIVKRFDDDDMRIDTGMFAPDTLWKRPLAGKLRIGYVNGLGQFITEFEPEPDRKRSGGSRLSKAVKKLVYKEEDKTKEEMALQVARMIVQEVIGLTLGATAAKLCNS